MFRLLMNMALALGLALAAGQSSARAEEAAAAGAELKEWFYAEGTSVFGPVGLTELRQLAMATIKAETQVYVQRNGWRPAKDHPELADLFPAAAAPAVAAPAQPVVAPPPPPPPPGSSPAEMDAKAVSYLQGTWQSEGPVQFGGTPYRLVAMITYGPNGILTGTWTVYELNGSLFMTLLLEGTYHLKATDAEHFILSGSWRYRTPEGGYTNPDSSTSNYRIIDANTVQAVESGNYMKRLR